MIVEGISSYLMKISNFSITWAWFGKQYRMATLVLLSCMTSQYRHRLEPDKLNLKINLPQDYVGGAALDMFFTDEHVTRADGKSIERLTESNSV